MEFRLEFHRLHCFPLPPPSPVTQPTNSSLGEEEDLSDPSWILHNWPWAALIVSY